MAKQGDLAQILSGMDILIKECNVAIHQPKIKEICAYGEDDFLLGIQMFANMKTMVEPVREGNSQLKAFSDFQLFIVAAKEERDIQKQLFPFLQFLFPNYIIKLDAGSINFFVEEQKKIVGQLNPNNIEVFIAFLKRLFLPQGAEELEAEYKPANDRAAEIAAKLKRGNEIRAKQHENDKKNDSIFAEYISILSVGLNMDINIFFEYTPFQLYNVFMRYSRKIASDLYQKVATTPLMDVSKMEEPVNWMDNLYKERIIR